ncbi:cysteine-rich receptor-like protein kinase 3 [Quercus suber]|uniref:cysteine-rich receptor-like protein kinase 3 n=1 Tax=Quercus suber TaxID=58331 RepID=UPI0032DEFAC2
MYYSIFVLLLFLLSFFVYSSLSDPRATEAALICTNKSAALSERQTFIANFLATMDTTTPLVVTQRYAAVMNGTGNTTVYTFGECMKDLSQTDCDLCFAQSKTRIQYCYPFVRAIRGGRLFMDGCYLRYDDYNFFNDTLDSQDTTVCGTEDFVGNHSVFGANVEELVRNLSVEAPKNDNFFVGFVNKGNITVYGLAQCWELVSRTGCERCLANAFYNISSCTPKEEGRVLNAGCYMRYSTQKFYYNASNTVGGNNIHQGYLLAITLAATSSALALVLVVTTVVFIVRKKILKKRRERKLVGDLLATLYKSKLNFSYEILERATNFFHSSSKLGQGGSGSVYKGVLPDGRVVAVKRLFVNSVQWVDHFFNEVNLISDIHHKNLVKLLGCSITGPESLLVYEYVPNQSLHDYFSVKKNLQLLRWDVRYKIILGTAEGLAYLHEESILRIIHRDIKLSNILLNEDLMPKIADFGLARLFPEDKTHISTAIAGTLGYMAPEYVVRGKLTEKVDVYSFGVLVLEVVCGKRNNSYSENSSILQMVWNLYEAGRPCEAVDPKLEANFQEVEAFRLLQIGLLCVQASAELRPSMPVVVKMLTYNQDIPQPTQPPFLNSSIREANQIVPLRAYNFQLESDTQTSGNSMTESLMDPR